MGTPGVPPLFRPSYLLFPVATPGMASSSTEIRFPRRTISGEDVPGVVLTWRNMWPSGMVAEVTT